MEVFCLEGIALCYTFSMKIELGNPLRIVRGAIEGLGWFTLVNLIALLFDVPH